MMNHRLALTLLFLAALLPVPAHAAKKNLTEASAAAADNSALPSARLEPFLEPCLDAILAPLEANPKLPRVEVEKLRSSFAGGQIKAKTPARQQIYQNGMAVCDALTKAMDDRANARSAAQASSKVPMRSAATGIIKGSPTRGVDAGALGEAIRRKQKDERRDADTEAGRNVAYMNSAAYRSWTEKAPRLRQGVMALYTRQIQLEALDEKNSPPAPTNVSLGTNPTPTATVPEGKPAKPGKKTAPVAVQPGGESNAGDEQPFLGKWKTRASRKTFLINADHTAVQLAEGSESDVKGTWEHPAKGLFVIAIEGVNITHYRLSEDGNALQGIGASARWERVSPTEAGVTTTTGTPAVAAKPAEKSSPAKQDSYAGTWAFTNGSITFLIKDDHTAVKTKRDGEKANGTWTVENDGDLNVKWEDHLQFKGKLSEDGQSIHSIEHNKILVRKP